MQATNFRLFERCARLKVPVILISSSAVYGSGGPDGGLDEETPRRPVSLYGLAKAVQEMLAERLAVSRGLELCIVRLFNLVGPGKAAGTVVPDWVAQVTAIMDGAEPVLRVKNRATSRDFVDVRDAARAVELVARRFVPDEVFNVASGQTVSLREVSDYLESLCPVPYRTVEADARCGSGDILYQFGDATRIAKAHGWAPTIGWKQSVREYWDHYLAARRDGETPSD
jgi:GDP-4-dehydro-6-deoxy-D-mannose reductase